MNEQPVARQELDEAGNLYVHHLFSTIQGEGPFTGERAIFVRLAGCNLCCPLCDTDYTSRSALLSAAQVASEVEALTRSDPTYLVVLSGGEPLRQNIGELIRLLVQRKYRVQIETNGTLWIPHASLGHPLVTIVCSPKGAKVNAHLIPLISAYKYVLNAYHVHPGDGLPLTALDHMAMPYVARPPPGFLGKVYVNPCDSGDKEENKKHLEAAIQSCMQFGYTLGVQLHKLIGLE
jgi:organic radical activating enzyme